MPYVLDDVWVMRLQKMWRKLAPGNLRIEGPGVTTINSEDGLTVQISQTPTNTTRNVPQDGVIPVTLSKTGGDDGTQSSACDWTYTVTHAITSTQLATGVAPEHNRLHGKVTPGTRGVCWMEGTTCHLILTDEIPTGGNCA